MAACAWLTFEYRGEHETLTRFWCVLVEALVAGQPTRLAAARHAVEVYGDDRQASDRYYSFDVLKSRLARKEWIAPDVRPLPTTQTP